MSLHTTTTSPPSVSRPLTYGDLITNTRRHVMSAIEHLGQPLPPDVAVGELAGYEQFAVRAGRHLQLLSRFTGKQVDGLWRLGHRLDRFTASDAAPGRWTQASTTLGAAHDLVATHFNHGAPRTPIAEELLTSSAGLGAAAELIEALIGAAPATAALVDRTLLNQRGTGELSLDAQRRDRIRTMYELVQLHGKAVMWDLSTRRPDTDANGLESLHVAATPQPVLSLSSPFDRSLAALDLLRRLSRDQSLGAAPASPASLRDLAALGAAATDPQAAWTGPDTALGRLRVAHASTLR